MKKEKLWLMGIASRVSPILFMHMSQCHDKWIYQTMDIKASLF